VVVEEEEEEKKKKKRNEPFSYKFSSQMMWTAAEEYVSTRH
jgi:hypothetical protein